MNKPLVMGIIGGVIIAVFASIISLGLTTSSDNTIISEAISKNPFQVYEINTVCELADLLLENKFSFEQYHEDFEKQVPAEWNERMSALTAEKKFWNELADEQITSSQYLTAEASVEIQEIENRIKILYYTMIMKYFSINPELEGEFVALYQYVPMSLLWLKDKHPECMPLLEEKYG